MSVDIYVRADGCCAAHDHQFTYNYSPALREAGFPSWKYLEGMKASTATIMINRLLDELAARPDHFSALIRGGGEWGTVTTLVDSLQRLREDMRRHPEGTVQVS